MSAYRKILALIPETGAPFDDLLILRFVFWIVISQSAVFAAAAKTFSLRTTLGHPFQSKCANAANTRKDKSTSSLDREHV